MTTAIATPSPFHAGEREIQRRLGVEAKMDGFGRKVIRDFMPPQHVDFYTQLPFLSLGVVDPSGRPWASLVSGAPGFVSSAHDRQLSVQADWHPDDPLAGALADGAPVGVLGMEMATRRRNRLTAKARPRAGGFDLDVVQTFGNCPQYIHSRVVEPVAPGARTPGPTERLEGLDAAARAMIAAADTFFVASYAPGEASSHGADVSHRGGKPGFVKIDEDGRLVVPDFHGNSHFNTLGNFAVYPQAGLTFFDFETGDLLMLTGDVEILWDDPEVEAFRGAERAWRFTPRQGLRWRARLPLAWRGGEASPNSDLTGSWAEAAATLAADRLRRTWRRYVVRRVEPESATIRSLYLEPEDGAGLPAFSPGQFLTVRLPVGERGVTRSYSLSSAPSDPWYRISVKREPHGTASGYVHDVLAEGDVIEARGPAGGFALSDSERPVVLLSAGVGVTPMLSMLRHVVFEGRRTRGARPTTFVHAARNARERAFFREARELAAAADGVGVFSILSRPEPGAHDHHVTGRIGREVLQDILPIGDYEFYLCGPGGFMQSVYDALRALGVRDARIFAEAFGPSALARTPDEAAPAPAGPPEAEAAVVEFTAAQVEQPWTPEAGTLLEHAEAHGLTPEFSCRTGSCGSCKTRLLEGEVTYRTPPTFPLEAGEVLPCCAVPAAAPSGGTPRLKVVL